MMSDSTGRTIDSCRCHDQAMHDHFTSRPFVWRWPKLTVLHAAIPRSGFVLNRYPHNVIGAGFYWRGRGLGLTWKGTA